MRTAASVSTRHLDDRAQREVMKMQSPWRQADYCVHRGEIGAPVLLVVEGNLDVQNRLAGVLSLAFPAASVHATTCARKSVEILTLQPVDIALVDLDLPNRTGIDVLQECLHVSPITRCVATTTCDDDEQLAAALAAGAFGYLLKNQPEAVLIQQLRLLGDGIPPLAPSVASRLVQHFAAYRVTMDRKVVPFRRPIPKDDLVALSERENEVLTLIAKGMQIADVAQLLAITPNTVCSHIKNIYRKRQLSSRAEAALEARRLGLV